MINMFPPGFGWLIHNVVGHPIMGVLQVFGFVAAGDWIHNATLPDE